MIRQVDNLSQVRASRSNHLMAEAKKSSVEEEETSCDSTYSLELNHTSQLDNNESSHPAASEMETEAKPSSQTSPSSILSHLL